MICCFDVSLPSLIYEKKATIYRDEALSPRGAVLYLHGGGLVFGDRMDLPAFHIEQLCDKGLVVIALDYPLVPAASILQIIGDIRDSVLWYLSYRQTLFSVPLPYFFWGRSAGAYLSLLMLREDLPERPAGLLSYYGYGLMEKDWAQAPNEFYGRYPLVSEAALDRLAGVPQARLSPEAGFPAYVHLRQTGRWPSLFLAGERENEHLFSLRDFTPTEALCPLFFAHSRRDPDVPFSEFCALRRLFPESNFFTVDLAAHDFDRDTDSLETRALLRESLDFLAGCLNS